MLKKILSRLLYIILGIMIGVAFGFYSATDVFRGRLKQHYGRSRMGGRIITGMATGSTIVSLTSEYPQYNGMDKNVSLNDFDPATVKLEVIARIASGTTAGKIKRYYFNIEDPSRILEVQYTPINTPYVYFVMQKLPGEYRYGVDIYDNQNNIIATSEGEKKIGPTIFFSPEGNEDIPIVILKVNKSRANVGDEVTLEAVAKGTSNRIDITADTEFSFDLDGDGEEDVVTKDYTITHTYTAPGTYKPRVKATYKGRSAINVGENIQISEKK